MDEEIKRLQAIIAAQEALIDWYEEMTERAEYEPNELPDGLPELEEAIITAELWIKGDRK